MTKNDVMKALAICNEIGNSGCADCPYGIMDNCCQQLAGDALALLQSTDDKHNVTGTPTYHTAIIYTKHTNLLPWLDGQYNIPKDSRVREHYSRNREVQLILLVRHEDIRIGDTIKHKCICRIKCPINPLPIKGEFECVSTGEMTRLLASMGWKYKEKVHSSMFK